MRLLSEVYKNFRTGAERALRGALYAVLLCCSVILVAFPVLAQEREFSLLGNDITFLGRTYDAVENRTHFNYRITRSLLAEPLKSLKLNLPNDAASGTQLVDVTAELPFSLTPDAEEGQSGLVLSQTTGSILGLLSSSDIDVEYLGDVQEGTVEAELATKNKLAKVDLVGPATIDIGYGGGDGGSNPGDPGTPPDCLLQVAEPILAAVGEPISVPLKLTGSLNTPLTMAYGELTSDASWSEPSGSHVDSNGVVSLNWTPKSEDVGKKVTFPISVSDTLSRTSLCDIDIEVGTNEPPVLNVAPIPNPLTCQGTFTDIVLDASASHDPEGQQLFYIWSHTCDSGAISNPSGAATRLRLSLPGTGVAQSCSVTVTVDDGSKTATATLPIQVPGCEVNCAPSQKDQCGVCNGNNSCYDCEGQAFGGKVVDRCGVCGGNNLCLDCVGEPNGLAVQDICGVCNGDGRTCQGCSEVNYQGLVGELDGSAAAASKNILRYIKKLPKKALKPKKRKNLIRKAQNTYQLSWQLVWQFPLADSVCSHYQGCLSQAASGDRQQYLRNSQTLRKVANQVSRIWKRQRTYKGKKNAKIIRRNAQREYQRSVDALQLYPELTHSCQ